MSLAGRTRRPTGSRRARIRLPFGGAGALSWLASFKGGSGVLALLLLSGVAWVPFGEAGRNGSEWAANAIFFGLLVLALEVIALFQSDQRADVTRRLLGPALLFIAAVLWALAQSAPLVPDSWKHPLWGLAATALAQPLEGRITIDVELTQLAILRLVTVASAFWVAAHLAEHAPRAIAMLYGVVAIISAHTLFAFLNPVRSPTQPTSLTLEGTFGNRNTLATFVGVGLVVAFGLLWRRLRSRSGSGGVGLVMADVLRAFGGGGAVLAAALMVLGSTLLLTGSRGGILSTILGLAALMGLIMMRRHRRSRGKLIRDVWIAAVATCLVMAVYAAFGDLVAGRISEAGLHDEGRVFLFRTALTAIAASPWLGYGYGTFMSVFPMFHDGSDDVWMGADAAHNTYLEVLLGLGVVAGSALIASIVWIAIACCRGALTREQSAMVPAIGASTAILVGSHALVDFSLQIEAVAITSAVVLGIGFAQSGTAGERLPLRTQSVAGSRPASGDEREPRSRPS